MQEGDDEGRGGSDQGLRRARDREDRGDQGREGGDRGEEVPGLGPGDAEVRCGGGFGGHEGGDPEGRGLPRGLEEDLREEHEGVRGRGGGTASGSEGDPGNYRYPQ